MKKLFVSLLATLFVAHAVAAVPILKPWPKASDIFIPVSKNGNRISLHHLAYISVKDYQIASGQPMNFAERVSFKLAQRQLRKNIYADGTVSKKIARSLAKITDAEYGFHTAGFLLGFFLNFIGVLIALLIGGDNKRNRVKWALWGMRVQLLIILIATLLLL